MYVNILKNLYSLLKSVLQDRIIIMMDEFKKFDDDVDIGEIDPENMKDCKLLKKNVAFAEWLF